MTDRTDLFPDIRGCIVLTDDGLGVYDAQRRFTLDAELSAALAGPIRAFRDHRLQHNDTTAWRVGIVYADYQPKPWHSATLALEDPLLRRLYPTGSSRGEEELTPFQRRNREKSLYRGLELLLDYRIPADRDRPFFCPVMYSRGTTLDQYLPWTERERDPRDRTLPVVEIINLLTGLPPGQRHDQGVERLLAVLRANIVRPDQRVATNLVILDGARRLEEQNQADPDPYAREPEQRILDELARHAQNRFQDWNYPGWFDQHCGLETRNNLGRWVRNGYTHSRPGELRFFQRFRTFDSEALRLLADKNPVLTVPPGTRLLERGTTDNWNLYLLGGQLELQSERETPVTVASGSEDARQPIGLVKPRLARVVARSRADFLWLYEPMVTAAARAFRPPPARPLDLER